MQLKVWFCINIEPPFHEVPVEDVASAVIVFNSMAYYTLNIPGVWATSGGLVVYNEDDQSWEEWTSVDGLTLDDILNTIEETTADMHLRRYHYPTIQKLLLDILDKEVPTK